MLSALEKKYFEIWFNVHFGLLNAKLCTRVEAYTHTHTHKEIQIEEKKINERNGVCVCVHVRKMK